MSLSESKIDALIDKYETLYKVRDLRKRFVPIEDIAKNPEEYGYSFPPRESKASQGDFLASKSKVSVVICGNRAGKTESGCVKFLRECFRRKGRAWVLSPSYDSQKSGVQEKIIEYLKPEDIEKTETAFGTALRSINLMNGTIIEFKTYEQGRSKLQSAKLIAAWFDEEPPEDIYDEVYTRTLDNSGQVIMTYTPLEGMTWSYEKILHSPSKNIKVYTWGMMDNPFIPLKEIEELKRNLSPKMANCRLYGNYQGNERAVFTSFERERNVKGGLKDSTMPVDVCIDWGVRVACITFWQVRKLISRGVATKHLYLVDAIELQDVGYGQVMLYCLNSGYYIQDWYCDPAGSHRSTGTKSGRSLLTVIKEEYGVEFKYLKRLGIEESIDLVNELFYNAYGESKLFIQEGIKLNDKGTPPEQRIENYSRDDDTHKPIDDEINSHLSDCIRYYCSNILRKSHGFRQR